MTTSDEEVERKLDVIYYTEQSMTAGEFCHRKVEKEFTKYAIDALERFSRLSPKLNKKHHSYKWCEQALAIITQQLKNRTKRLATTRLQCKNALKLINDAPECLVKEESVDSVLFFIEADIFVFIVAKVLRIIVEHDPKRHCRTYQLNV
jgi:hypothetical protein